MDDVKIPTAAQPAQPTVGGWTKAWRYFLPLVIFVGLIAFLYKGLSLDPRALPSRSGRATSTSTCSRFFAVIGSSIAPPLGDLLDLVSVIRRRLPDAV